MLVLNKLPPHFGFQLELLLPKNDTLRKSYLHKLPQRPIDQKLNSHAVFLAEKGQESLPQEHTEMPEI